MILVRSGHTWTFLGYVHTTQVLVCKISARFAGLKRTLCCQMSAHVFSIKVNGGVLGAILGRFRRLKRAKKTRQKTLCAHTLMLIIGNLCTVLCN